MWPEIWSSKGVVQEFSENKKPQDFPGNFNVFINEGSSFLSNFTKLEIKNIQKKFFTLDKSILFFLLRVVYNNISLWNINKTFS